MPQRFLKPGLRSSKRWDACSWMAQSFYVRLLTLVDDYGRYEADSILLKNEAFPLREDIRASQVCELLHELEDHHLLIFYKADGKQLLALTLWTERARYKSRFPAPPSAIADKYGCKLEEKDNCSCLADNLSPPQTPKPSAVANSHNPKPITKPKNGLSTWEIKQQIEAIKTQIEDVRARGYEDAFGLQFDDPQDKKELKRLKKKIKELNDTIANKAFEE